MVRAERAMAASTKELELLSERLKHEVQQRVAAEGMAITVAPCRHNLYPKNGSGLFDIPTADAPTAHALHTGAPWSKWRGEGSGGEALIGPTALALAAAETRAAEAEAALRELRRALLEREVLTASLQLQVQERDHQVRPPSCSGLSVRFLHTCTLQKRLDRASSSYRARSPSCVAR